jgi:hypothetical protein
MTTFTFVDTSVLCELLEVPGKSSPAHARALKEEADRRYQEGERFVIPITTVIETGNHIAQADGNRFEVAARLVRLLELAVAEQSPWRVLRTSLGPEFLTSLCAGDSTGQSLPALAAAKVGAGDVALLVERDQLRAASAAASVLVWTLDAGLAAQASAS